MLGTRLISVQAFLPLPLQLFSSELALQVAARIALEHVVHHHPELQSTDFKSSNRCYSMHFIHCLTPLIKLHHTNEGMLEPYLHCWQFHLRSSDQTPPQTNSTLHSLLPLWFPVRPLPAASQLLSQLIVLFSFSNCYPSFSNSSLPSAHIALSSSESHPHGPYSTVSAPDSELEVATFILT